MIEPTHLKKDARQIGSFPPIIQGSNRKNTRIPPNPSSILLGIEVSTYPPP